MDLEVCDDVGAKLYCQISQFGNSSRMCDNKIHSLTIKKTSFWTTLLNPQQVITEKNRSNNNNNNKKIKQTYKKMTYTKQAGRGDVAPSRFHTKLVTEYTWYATFQMLPKNFNLSVAEEWSVSQGFG